MYIVRKDIKKNTITVSENAIIPNSNNKEFALENVNWISESPKAGRAYDAQVRYHQDYQKCKIEGNKIIFSSPQIAASGQSIVVYNNDACLGGGVIK
jgi:tRNA-specific 2-thiouridylase